MIQPGLDSAPDTARPGWEVSNPAATTQYNAKYH